jgi:hypothetical protein
MEVDENEDAVSLKGGPLGLTCTEALTSSSRVSA